MALMAFELGLQPFEKREGVGGGAGEPRDHLAVAELADLAGVGLHHRLPHRDLAVTGDHDLAALAYRHDRRTVPLHVIRSHGMVYGRVRRAPQSRERRRVRPILVRRERARWNSPEPTSGASWRQIRQIPGRSRSEEQRDGKESVITFPSRV